MTTATRNNAQRNKKKTSVKKSATKRTTRQGRPRTSQRNQIDDAVKNEVVLIGIFAAAIFLFLCDINVIRGDFGTFFKSVMFGIFGVLAYIIPVIFFLAIAFEMSNKGNTIAILKLVAGVVFVFLIGMFATIVTGQLSKVDEQHVISSLYLISNDGILSGGGVLFGTITYFIYSHIGIGGTIFLLIVLGIICVVIMTEKSFLAGVKKGGHIVYETTSESLARRRERLMEEEFDEEPYSEEFDDRKKKKEEYVRNKEENKIKNKRRLEKKARGVMPNPLVMGKEQTTQGISDYNVAMDDLHEITIKDLEEDNHNPFAFQEQSEMSNAEKIEIRTIESEFEQEFKKSSRDFKNQETTSFQEMRELHFPEEEYQSLPDRQDYLDTYEEDNSLWSDVSMREEAVETYESADVTQLADTYDFSDPISYEGEEERSMEVTVDDYSYTSEKMIPDSKPSKEEVLEEKQKMVESIEKENEALIQKEYKFPPIQLLKKGDKSKNGDSTQELRKTAYQLQQTLKTFGVNVTVTNFSQGPAVTRFELQPEQGVKVSKIVGLSDDIKLNLAATDIRIEAPIPGKAAVGIEVPNKVNAAVAFRDLIESKEFQQFPSNIAFAVGKDISGQIVVTDIAKMPHLLIAGATGSGKSVCINTIIMGILYKAKPEDVKLIMIDPKVVELSVYNGIPHLLIPVVTDPKKAAAALQWGVSEMTDRYNKFADLNVRDMKGYNKLAEKGTLDSLGNPLKKMPQIVIIVDELADLMMVASGDVEASICRLAQLARAAGIHLIIATQRPSVDVITGLIKANMPSRIAFSVSSGVDSRTILDMNGAEKLLGRGDMLFYPQGYSKPARVQGAFVSDSEVSDVVDCIKNQAIGNSYTVDIEEKISNIKAGGGQDEKSEVDTYFVEAGKLVIDKDKASIGMLQRVFKIGFNRAARIVDQLEAAGVVGQEEGTKPRKILMSLTEFENYVEEMP